MSPIPQTTEFHSQIIEVLEQLFDRSASRSEFLAGLLPELVKRLPGATAGVIWLSDDQGHLRPAFLEGWHQLGITSAPQRAQKHRQMIATAASRQQVLLFGPHNRSDEELPHNSLFAVGPVKKQHQMMGLLELVFSAELPESEFTGIIQIIEACSGYVSEFQEKQTSEFLSHNTLQFWQETEPLLFRIYQQLDSRRLAYEASGAFRQKLDVERVTILAKTGQRVRILAVSGQVEVSSYSPIIKNLKTLVEHTLKHGEVLLHTGGEISLQLHVKDLLSEYLELSGTQMLAIMPLWSFPEEYQSVQEPNRQREHGRRLVGAMVIERSRSHRFDSERKQVAELFADHLGNALQRAQEHESIFLLPVWRTLGHSLRWLHRHHFWKSMIVLGMVLAVSLSLSFMPWEYRITGEGNLMPVIQHQVFAPWEAEVDEVYVTGGENVTAGTLLLRLTSKELEAEEIRLRTLIQEKQTSLKALRTAREIGLKTGKKEEVIEIEGRYAEHQVEIRHLELQHHIILERLDSLLIKAPIDGVVTTFQVKEILLHRPINRGDLLVEVMGPAGNWHLELKVEDRRMGHLLNANRHHAEIPVSYVLATDPETAYKGQIEKVDIRANTEGEKGNLVSVYVTIPSGEKDEKTRDGKASSEIPPLRIGAEVKAKISCGAKPLGYVLFGDVIDYLRKTLWL